MSQDYALDFTLELLRKKFLPELKQTSAVRVLLLGAGTLGCHLSRALLSWGFTQQTFLDHGAVRPTNPHRQPLYTTADVGRPKAECAAAAVRALSPAAQTEGLQLSIPSPGSGALDAGASLGALEATIQAHDVVFLCTDTRESRWAPAYLCSLTRTPCIALGLTFDVRFRGFPQGWGAGLSFCSPPSHALPPSLPFPPDFSCGAPHCGLCLLFLL